MQDDIIESLVMLACETLDPHHLEHLGNRLVNIARDAQRHEASRGGRGGPRGGGGHGGPRGGGGHGGPRGGRGHGGPRHEEELWDMPEPFRGGGGGGRGGGRGGRGGAPDEGRDGGRGGRGGSGPRGGGGGGRGGPRGGGGGGGSGWPHGGGDSPRGGGLGELQVTSGDDHPREDRGKRGSRGGGRRRDHRRPGRR